MWIIEIYSKHIGPFDSAKDAGDWLDKRAGSRGIQDGATVIELREPKAD